MTATSETTRPNPLRVGSHRGTEIAFALPEAGSVRLAVYDVLGREVGLVLFGRLSAGPHVSSWVPAGISPGVYFLRLANSRDSVVRKVTLVE